MSRRTLPVAMMLAMAAFANAPVAEGYRAPKVPPPHPKPLKGTPPNQQRMTKAQRKAEKRARSHAGRRKKKP